MPTAAETAQDQRCAAVVLEAYERFASGFFEITRRARGRFERREWRAMQVDTRARLDLYQHAIEQALTTLGSQRADLEARRALWTSVKRHYCSRVSSRDDAELAETFFNSVARRVLGTVGVDPDTEFSEPGHLAPIAAPSRLPFHRYAPRDTLAELVGAVLADSGFAFGDLEGDTRRVAQEMERLLAERDAPPVECIDVLPEPFFRGQVAYVIGQVWAGDEPLPLAIALLNPAEGIGADAVTLDAHEVSAIFSLSRSYFFHAQPDVGATVRFLEPLIKKPRAELYTALGHKRHGKTELYRHLCRQLVATGDRFNIAPGSKGLVMLVFTMPSLDIVFKVIRDSPGRPKDTSRAEVMQRYRLVFQHDRVGRLLDAQEFEHLRFARSRFSEPLLCQLLTEAPERVSLDGDTVVLGHAYAERKVVPLDLFVRQRDEPAVRAAVLDYGKAIKELAAANIFPGDILLKNFGVKPDGRVVFYDYDELTLLTAVNFRALPQTDDVYDEVSGEPWFYVGEHDVFPEEFPTFIALPLALRELLAEVHGEIFTVEFWKQMQERHRAGELIRVLPYARRLPPVDG